MRLLDLLSHKEERTELTLSWFQDRLSEFKYTPDQYKLDQYLYQFVFVADELMKNFPLHNNFITDARYFGSAYTINSFSVFKYKVPEKVSPVILPIQYHHPPARRVKGELWLLPASRLSFIDRYKMNTEVFQRLRVPVNVPYRELVDPRINFDNRGVYFSEGVWYNIPKMSLTTTRMAKVRAWMYVAIPSYWEPLLDGGYMFSPVSRYMSRNKNIGEYYYFSRNELAC